MRMHSFTRSLTALAVLSALALGTSKKVTLVQRGDNYMPFKSITLK